MPHQHLAGRKAPRSKNGCLTCRQRRIKCDETRPVCSKCISQPFSCDWASTQPGAAEAVGHVQLASHHTAKVDVQTVGLSLHDTSFECANSVVLTLQERRCLGYFKSSAIHNLYSFGRWGTLEYVVQEVAASDAGVMRMILATSASEMYRKGLQSPEKCDANAVAVGVDMGVHHYNMALQHLRDCIGKQSDITAMKEESLEAMIATIFFMVNYEVRFSIAAEHRVKAHFGGLWAVISAHPLFQDGPDGESPSRHPTNNPSLVLCSQLILWLLYTDITATNTGTSTSLLKLLSHSTTSSLISPSRLFRTARMGSAKVWGKKSPPSQILFDMEIHRAVEFGQILLSLRFNIWDTAMRQSGDHIDNDSEVTPSALLEQLLRLEETYADILQLALAASPLPWSQTLESVTRIAASYYACVLFHRRLLCPHFPSSPIYEEALSNLPILLFRHYEHEHGKGTSPRLVWTIFVAAIEMRDVIHKRWLKDRLWETRREGEGKWAWETSEAIFMLQEKGKGDTVDLREYMKAKDQIIS